MRPHAMPKILALAGLSLVLAAPAFAQPKTAEDYRREADAFEAEAARQLGPTPAAKPAPRPAQQAPAVRAAPAAAPVQPPPASGLPVCRAGLHVPRVSPLNYGATILAVDPAKGSYKVKSDADGLIDWVSSYSLRTSCTGAVAQAITADFFIGDWEMFVGPTPNNVVIGGKAYIEVGPGAKAPPIVVRKDGGYSWKIDSKTTVTGRWRALAPNEMRNGTVGPAILLMKGESGKDWQMSRRGTALADNRDQANIDRMDLGLSYMATRAR